MKDEDEEEVEDDSNDKNIKNNKAIPKRNRSKNKNTLKILILRELN